MSVWEQWSIFLISLVATFPGGTLGAAVAGGSWWKGAITVTVGVPLSIVFFLFLPGASWLPFWPAAQLICSVAIVWILGMMLAMSSRHILGAVIGSLLLGAVAAGASICYISLQHSASL
jgi:hypothetical protein